MAKRYLDPKADLTFKKVFGEHPDLVISLLNALLPFKTQEEEIQSVEYLTPEMVPDNPLRKNSIVDVRCKDLRGRQFIVEMQMVWSPEFMQRVMFNSAKAYVRQLDKQEDYHLLEPVYSLNLVNDVFLNDVPEYYHYYRMVHEKHTEKVIDGLHLVFVELPKFTPHTMKEKKMHVLWLRYLTEIDGYMETVPQELLDNPEISKAMEVVEESAFSPEQLLGYDKFWDIIRTETTLYNSGVRQGQAKGLEQGLEEGMKKGRAEGLAEGLEKGRAEGLKDTARNLKSMGLGIADIQKATGLSEEDILRL
ncbi:MAG: Rpn family recombination-promoting nuclease/putative transposase [Phocaeicola plebeius]|nr:Rpn family recombination-promoting nuclease/putative transposase [Phocaeicola plebeius]